MPSDDHYSSELWWKRSVDPTTDDVDGQQHAVEFLTGREVARLDEDPVLDRCDYWRGSL